MKWSIAEIATVIGVAATLLGSLLVYAAKVSDRLVLMEDRIERLRVDVDSIDQGSPLVNARLERQRADLDALGKRVEVLCKPSAP